jgi:hypothetical protein
MNYVNNGNYTVQLSGGTIACSYAGPNTQYSMGICTIFFQAGYSLTAPASSNGNTWCLANSNLQNGGESIATFVCWNMNAGVDTLTASVPTPAIMTLRSYTFTTPAYFIAVQPKQVAPIIPYVAGSQGIVYAPLSIADPVTAYYNPQSGGVEQNVTVTMFLDVYDTASYHSWMPHAGGAVRQSAEFTSASVASGDNIVSSGGSQTVFSCQFQPYWVTSAVTPETQVCAMLVVELNG